LAAAIAASLAEQEEPKGDIEVKESLPMVTSAAEPVPLPSEPAGTRTMIIMNVFSATKMTHENCLYGG
jgi:hypothetical protein